MLKVSLTVYYNTSYAGNADVFKTIQETDMDATQCSEELVNLDTKAFCFGNAVIYTEGVRAFVFEDVEND